MFNGGRNVAQLTSGNTVFPRKYCYVKGITFLTVTISLLC